VTFLTEPQRRTVFDEVLTLVDTKFSGVDVDVSQLRDVHGPRVVGSRTLEDFEQALDGLLRDLKTSHTGFFHEARPRSAGRIAMAATLTKANTAADGRRTAGRAREPIERYPLVPDLTTAPSVDCQQMSGVGSQHMTPDKSDVLYGTLGLMVIKTLEAMGPLHGYRIARRIEQISGNQLALNQGTLYPALLKLEQVGWISSKWGKSETGRRVRIYALTRAGRKQLQKEEAQWQRAASIVERFLKISENAT